MLKIIITMLLFIMTTLMADEQMTVDSQIEKIKSASPSQRVQLMNAFKIKVSQMNNQERSDAIQKMYLKMSPKNSALTNTHASKMQIQNSSQISNYQNMNQNQAGNQLSNNPAKIGNAEGYKHGNKHQK